MTTTKNKTLVPGDRIHFLRSGFSFGTKLEDVTGVFVHTSTRGETVTLTADIIELAKDRLGDSWLDLVDDLDAQAQRWSNGPYFARGQAPDDLTAWEPNGIEQVLEFEAQRQRIYETVADEEGRAAALSKLRSSALGRNLPTLRNTVTYAADAPKNARGYDGYGE